MKKPKYGAKVKWFEGGKWRHGTFEGVSCQRHLGLVLAEPPTLVIPDEPDSAIRELVPLEDIVVEGE